MFLLKVRGTLRDLEDKLAQVSTEEQRETAIALANEQEEWLYDDGWNEDAATYRKKRAQLAEVSYSSVSGVPKLGHEAVRDFWPCFGGVDMVHTLKTFASAVSYVLSMWSRWQRLSSVVFLSWESDPRSWRGDGLSQQRYERLSGNGRRRSRKSRSRSEEMCSRRWRGELSRSRSYLGAASASLLLFLWRALRATDDA